MARIPPTARKLTFEVPGEVAHAYIDIGQCLSLQNRKAFRQGLEYYVESWTITSTVASKVGIFNLQQSWVNCNAWTKALHTWMTSQEQVEDFEEIKGRYHDFKVYFDVAHATAGVAANILPEGFDPALVTAVSATAAASWDPSEIQIPNVGSPGNTVGYQMHMLGPDAASKGIVEGYANSRARPQLTDPNTLQGTYSWMTDAFDTGDNLGEIITDLTYENDSPPYFIDEDSAHEFYPGGSNQSNGAGKGFDVQPILAINPAVGSWATKHGSGFIAPCGLLHMINDGESDVTLTLNIAVGPLKGVMARPMQDVN